LKEITIKRSYFNDRYHSGLDDDTPTQVVFGSSSAGKSYSYMHYAALWAMQGRTIVIARKVARHIKKSVYSEVSKAMRRMGFSKAFTDNKTEMTFVSKRGNGAIIFVGADDPNKLKSITAPKGDAIDCIIMEEADQFTSEDFDVLVSRMRGQCAFKKKVILIFNPVSKLSWIFKRLFEPIGWDDEVDMEYQDEHIHIKRCIYSDNSHLAPEEVDRIERLKTVNPMFYRVYGLGKFGVVGARVFSAYEVKPFAIDRTKPVKVGVDFGYSHKSAAVYSYRDPILKIIYVFAELGVRGKTRSEFAKMIKDKHELLGVGNPTMECDSAEPASIKELKVAGLSAVPAKKGPDSLLKSYDFIKDHIVVIHPSCTQLTSEFDTMVYQKDGATGEYKEEPVNVGDDLVAALRYSYSSEYMRQGTVKGSRGLY